MNIFAVDNNPFTAAKDLPDKLIVKMPVESCQMLTPWAYNTFGAKFEKPASSDKRFYGVKGFAHHPCSKWLYESPSNVAWLIEHAFGMVDEYWLRYGRKKYHGSAILLKQIQELFTREYGTSVESLLHTEFVQAMPEEFRIPGNPVQAYRNYVNGSKGYAEWRYSEKPEWWDEERHSSVRNRYLAQREENLIKRRNAKNSRKPTSIQS